MNRYVGVLFGVVAPADSAVADNISVETTPVIPTVQNRSPRTPLRVDPGWRASNDGVPADAAVSSRLLAGQVDIATAAAVGASLGKMHAASAHRPDLLRDFDTTSSFYALRLEPYFIATGVRYPKLVHRLHELVEATAATRVALVHGDVSPKNILVGPSGPVLLDAECAWYGDPAFDVAFCLNHLLLKSVVRPDARDALRQSFGAFVSSYFEHAAAIEPRRALERRAAALLPALMLARVDGKSPVEYIRSDEHRERVRRASMPLLRPDASPERSRDIRIPAPHGLPFLTNFRGRPWARSRIGASPETPSAPLRIYRVHGYRPYDDFLFNQVHVHESLP